MQKREGRTGGGVGEGLDAGVDGGDGGRKAGADEGELVEWADMVLMDDSGAVVAEDHVGGAAYAEEAADGGAGLIEAALGAARVFDHDNGGAEDEGGGVVERWNFPGETLVLGGATPATPK